MHRIGISIADQFPHVRRKCRLINMHLKHGLRLGKRVVFADASCQRDDGGGNVVALRAVRDAAEIGIGAGMKKNWRTETMIVLI